MTMSNCSTCDHKKINRDPELHCYMFKVAPEGVCGQHTGHKEEIKAFAALIRGDVEETLALARKRRSFGRMMLDPEPKK